jgi:hypothetical protein
MRVMTHRVPDKFTTRWRTSHIEDDPPKKKSALFRRHEKVLAALEQNGRKNHMTAFWT